MNSPRLGAGRWRPVPNSCRRTTGHSTRTVNVSSRAARPAPDGKVNAAAEETAAIAPATEPGSPSKQPATTEPSGREKALLRHALPPPLSADSTDARFSVFHHRHRDRLYLAPSVFEAGGCLPAGRPVTPPLCRLLTPSRRHVPLQ